MARHYELISADGHVETPPDPWVRYVPEKWKDRAPRLIKLDDGGEGWVVEGQPLLRNGQNITGRDPICFILGLVLDRRTARRPTEPVPPSSACGSRTRTGSTPRCFFRRCSPPGSSRASRSRPFTVR